MDWINEHMLPHWPFAAVCSVLWVIGHFMERSVFTKARAHAESKMQWLWWWGRESMELHPIIAGALVGLVWQDPEGADWSWTMSMAYFAFAGVCSLFGWKLIAKVLERAGIDPNGITMPGESEPPKQ